ncbi:hypothetical protein B5P41_32145, partial [Bacillus sp. SRB_28]
EQQRRKAEHNKRADGDRPRGVGQLNGPGIRDIGDGKGAGERSGDQGGGQMLMKMAKPGLHAFRQQPAQKRRLVLRAPGGRRGLPPTASTAQRVFDKRQRDQHRGEHQAGDGKPEPGDGKQRQEQINRASDGEKAVQNGLRDKQTSAS